MQDSFDGEVPPEVIDQYPADEVEELGVIDLGKGVSPTRIRIRHYQARRRIRNMIAGLLIAGIMFVLWQISALVFFCALAPVGLFSALLLMDAYVKNWRQQQERFASERDENFWWR